MIPQPNDVWLDAAIKTSREMINKLVREFLEYPYLHRVEHSIHVRLYSLLLEQEIFKGQYPIGDGPLTLLVHKEWPAHRPGKKGRGHFDLAILSPEQLSAMSVDDFENGRPVPSIAIEMGLKYQWEHLQKDMGNIQSCGVPERNGFLVHLDRKPHRKSTIGDVEKCIEGSRIKDQIAYAHFDPKTGRKAHKYLGDMDVTCCNMSRFTSGL